MNNKALKTLEFYKIIDQLSDLAQSVLGKKMCQQLQPYNTYQIVLCKQKETTEAVTMIYKKGNIPLKNFKDIHPEIHRLNIGGVLGMIDFLNISNVLEITSKLKQYEKTDVDLPSLTITNYFEQLEPLTPLYKKINKCILSEEEMSDDASHELRNIRRKINRTNERIHEKLNQLINSSSVRNMLQENVITLRNNRYCLPVKQEYRQQFSGMIHDQSSSGATLFIEPMSVVKLNNEIKELTSKEQEEIERILSELSAETAGYTNELTQNIETLAMLDFIFAKASLSIKHQGSEPIFNNDGIIQIKKARHPLLDKETAVPIDVVIGKEFDMLVITGPNTGGKTVSLKTVGLLTLMGQSGLHIPAFDKSKLAFFEEVYADIGDEQSIEQNLSTFSSHMTNIINILNNADNKSLVLFDELGAGTDPTEGAALAMSILQYLHEKKVRTIATTHYSELKIFALSTEGIENASCEFDVKTLKPTYKLLIGIPGKSNAFAISKRLGLPNYIIDDAKQLISQDTKQFEDLISDLENNRKTIETEKEKAKQNRKNIETLKKELEEKQRKIENQKDSIINSSKEEAHKILKEAKEYADSTIRKFNKWSQNTGNINQATLEKERQDIRTKLSNIEDSIISNKKTKRNFNKSGPKNIKVGDTVFVSEFNQKGTVLKPENNKGEVLVQLGIIKTSVHKSSLSYVQEETINNNIKKPNISKNKSNLSKSKTINTEIDVRGKTVEEALSYIEKYIDDAYLSHLSQITIIHGKGTGALRKAIHSYLKRLKYVTDYRLGNYGEGESGVTIVEL
ncbi:MAG: endonuclease MutS2 [Eubacteriales bacterium]